MKTTIAGLTLVVFVFAAYTAIAHNGEYKPPVGRSKGPPGRTRTPTGGTGVPTPGPGGSSTPKLDGPETTPTPGAVSREEALSWELVWELVRSAEPAPPPELPEESRTAVTTALRAATTDENLEVRMWSSLALARSGAGRDLLLALAEDGDLMRTPAMLAPAFLTLDDEGREVAIGLLTSVIEDPEAPPGARYAAILAAGSLGPKGANLLLKTLGNAARGPDRDACLFALGLSGHPGARDLLVPAVLPPKKDDDPVARALLVLGLSRLPGPDVGRDLLKRLRDPAMAVRTAAALSLGRRRVWTMPEVEGALVDLAKSGPMRPRSAALLTLVIAGNRKAPDLCRKVLAAERGSSLAPLAALGLGLTRSALAGPELVKMVGDRSLARDLRCAAAVAAGLVRARGGAGDLRKTAEREKDPIVAGYAFLGAILIDPEKCTAAALTALKKQKRRRGRCLLVQALGHASGEKVVAELVARLGDDYEVNREAARSLFRVDPARAASEALTRLTDEKNPFARRYGAIVFGGALDSERPTRFAKVVLGTGLDARHPVAELLLYLENDVLHGMWGKR